MEKSERPRGVICFTNPAQLPYIRQHGIYGNVDSGDTMKRIRYGKLKDLLNVTQGDLVFLFEKEVSKLHGVWKVWGDPFFSTVSVFDPSNIYPYRFFIQQYLNFATPIPVVELRKLLDKNVIWSMRTFEREARAPLASVNPISCGEAEALLELFWRYNHRIDPTLNVTPYSHPSLSNQINFYDLVTNNIHSSNTNLEIRADDFGQLSQTQIVEEALHCYLIYNMVRRTNEMQNHFGQYCQVMREVPVSVAGQQRPDILLIYENPLTREPTVYSLIEAKVVDVEVGMLRQLIEYVKLFAERHSIDSSCIEGTYIGPHFSDEAKDYVIKRASVEAERPLRLIEYQIAGNTVTLHDVI